MDKKAKYMEVVDFVKEKMKRKEINPGDKLYSENELSDMFHLSRQTVRHAIGILEEEGIVSRVRGSGTYIQDNRNAELEGRTRIAVVSTYVDSYIFPKTIQGMQSVLFEKGYSVQIAFTNNEVEKEREILEDIIAKDEIAGLIIEPTKSGLPNPNVHLYEQLKERRIPVIFFNSFYPQLDIYHVSVNDKLTAKKATEYLIQAGHKNIGGIFKLDDGQGVLRYAGYMEAMKAAGLPAGDSGVMWLDTEDLGHLSEQKDKILTRTKNCTAIFCYNDQVAFQVSHLLRKEGIEIPEQISLISIDDSELASLGKTKLHSFPHPKELLGEKVAENLLKMIHDSSFYATYEFEPEVVERSSVSRFR